MSLCLPGGQSILDRPLPGRAFLEGELGDLAIGEDHRHVDPFARTHEIEIGRFGRSLGETDEERIFHDRHGYAVQRVPVLSVLAAHMGHVDPLDIAQRRPRRDDEAKLHRMRGGQSAIVVLLKRQESLKLFLWDIDFGAHREPERFAGAVVDIFDPPDDGPEMDFDLGWLLGGFDQEIPSAILKDKIQGELQSLTSQSTGPARKAAQVR